jgi:hypothetical protein
MDMCVCVSRYAIMQLSASSVSRKLKMKANNINIVT